MWTLSGFADEIAPDLTGQLRTLADCGISHLELRGVWGKNVLALSDAEVETIQHALRDHGVKVSAIGSPIGKIGITDDFAPHLVAFDRALELAERFDAPFVRIFSFFIPAGDDPATYRGEVLSRLEQLVRLAEDRGITLAHENERHIYGESPERCHDLLSTIDSPRFRAVWDAANFVVSEPGQTVGPHDRGFDLLRLYIAYVHIKDAIAQTGEIVPAGEGDGQVRETLAALHADGFDGFFSLEPHLANAGTFSGFSGAANFQRAANAFTGLLRDLGVQWS